jgi:glucosamine--fructose-6-phosphate aminotransferase (isomerizing)
VKAEGFLRDVLAAPDRLAGVVDLHTGAGAPIAELPASVRSYRRVVLIGMGSSRFAAEPVAALLRSRGVDAVAEPASSDSPTAPASDLLAVGISASGRTPETVEALARHRGVGPTLALTNDPSGGDLAAVADDVLPLHAGPEEGGVACLSFQATLAVLLLLADALTGANRATRALAAAVAAAGELRDTRGEWLPPVVAVLDGPGTIHLVAPASRLSSALQGALMLREGPRLDAAASETGDWLHVDVYLTKRPGYRLLLFTGSRFDAEVLRWTGERGSTVVAVGTPLPGARLMVPVGIAGETLVSLLVETAVAELAAAELWRLGLERGDPALAAG